MLVGTMIWDTALPLDVGTAEVCSEQSWWAGAIDYWPRCTYGEVGRCLSFFSAGIKTTSCSRRFRSMTSTPHRWVSCWEGE